MEALARAESAWSGLRVVSLPDIYEGPFTCLFLSCSPKRRALTLQTALRFFTVYGPWGRPDMAVASFAERCVQLAEAAERV